MIHSSVNVERHIRESGPMTDAEIIEMARAHTWMNGSHAMTNYVAFARALQAYDACKIDFLREEIGRLNADLTGLTETLWKYKADTARIDWMEHCMQYDKVFDFGADATVRAGIDRGMVETP